jgi:hypothetical protein
VAFRLSAAGVISELQGFLCQIFDSGVRTLAAMVPLISVLLPRLSGQLPVSPPRVIDSMGCFQFGTHLMAVLLRLNDHPTTPSELLPAQKNTGTKEAKCRRLRTGRAYGNFLDTRVLPGVLTN